MEMDRPATQRRVATQSSDSSQEQHRKSRRIARKTGQAGPSGWKHDDKGDGRDLVPPSDVEEYEEWKERRHNGSRGSTPGGLSGSDEEDMEYGMVPSTALPNDYASPRDRETGASQISPPTSVTLPLDRSRSKKVYARRSSCDNGEDIQMGGSESSFADDEEDQDGIWPILVSSGRRPRGRTSISRSPAPQDPLSMSADGVSDDQWQEEPAAHRRGRKTSEAIDVPDVREDLKSPDPPKSKEYEPPPLDDSLVSISSSPDPIVEHLQEEDDWHMPYGSIPLDEYAAAVQGINPGVDDAGLTQSLQAVAADLGSPEASQQAHLLLSPLPSISQDIALSQNATQPAESPLVEAQIGPHNVRNWRHSHRSRSPEDASQDPLDVLSTPISTRMNQDTPRKASQQPLASHPPDPPARPPVDPALARFQTARTFRTRTTLQLQPYTKERQIYEAALKRSGLKNGTRAVARAREISPSDEDREPEGPPSSSSAAPQEDSERIIIGNTPPQVVKPARAPKELVDADFDEYFLEFGTPADEDDPSAASRLQRIARARLRLVKEENKRHREEAKKRRQFEKLMREGRGDPTPLSDSSGSITPPPKVKAPRPAKFAAGQIRTYKTKNQAVRLVSARPRSPSVRSCIRLDTPATADMQQDMDAPLSGHDHFQEYSPNLPDDLMPMGDPALSRSSTNSPFEKTPIAHDALGTATNMHTGDSFVIDDLPDALSLAREESPDSDSSSSTPVDRRQKIARRMMPAFMLRRLEQEAAQKQRQKDRQHRRGNRAEPCPVRPGRAVVRRGQGNPEGLFDFVDSDADSTASIVEISQGLSPSPVRHRQQQLYVISDDSQSSSSQAYEDNAGAQSLARLYEGDFETIIAGRRPALKSIVHKSRRPFKRARPSRPPLGMARRGQAVKNSSPRELYQSRLDFPPEDRRRSPQPKSRKRKKSTGRSRQEKRPAIRLDDHVIFSHEPFAFDVEGDDRSNTPTDSKWMPRKTPRTPRTPLKQTTMQEHLDTGIGKARSWANFEEFPIDFGITPLPSGLSCHPDSYVGSGRLCRLLDIIRGKPVVEPMEAIVGVSAYGVELRDDMASAAIASVIPIVFGGIRQATIDFVHRITDEEPNLQSLIMIRQYIEMRHRAQDGDFSALVSETSSAITGVSAALESVSPGEGRHARRIHNLFISIRLQLLDLACICRASAMQSERTNVLFGVATDLLGHLLSSRFDLAIRPLKQILRGESESPEIDNPAMDAWITLIHLLASISEETDLFTSALGTALERAFGKDETGPIAAERIWFLIFGLCALSQFGPLGKTSDIFTPNPRWSLVRRAIALIRISHNEEAEEKAHIDQLRGRDRYIKVMIARCVCLSSVWKWSFDQGNFSIATKDLGVIFKNRQHRNLPTEPPVDYPDFITHYDMSLTAAETDKRETAFEMYLRLVCVAASDVIGSAKSLSEAQQAEKDVQRLIMSIIPVSPLKFNRVLPPTLRQVGQLVNRYSTMIAACYFSPSLLPWLLVNSRKWVTFDHADFESRQICIRGLMYLAVACRHHDASLDRVVDALGGLLATLQNEVDDLGKPDRPAQAPTKMEIERTMVLVVACFRQIIQHHSFDPETQSRPVYPDPCLLHESWTGRIFSLDLASDHKCGMEVVATIQAFLDARASALPRLAKQRRQARGQGVESQDEYSFGIDFTAVDLAALGGEATVIDPVERQEEDFAKTVNNVISPRIYRLLSDMFPLVEDMTLSEDARDQRSAFINKLTKCWSDCAGVVVVELNYPEGWTPYIGPFGRESWQRIRNEQGRLQVGLHFMLNVATVDPGCYILHEEIFLGLLFQSIVTHRWTIEHKYLSALLAMHHVLDSALFSEVALIPGIADPLDRSRFMELRPDILRGLFTAIPHILASKHTSASTKTLIYRCINILVSAMINNEKSIDRDRTIQKESYHQFAVATATDLVCAAGEFITPLSVPGLKHFA